MRYAVYLDKSLGKALVVPQESELVFDGNKKQYKFLDSFDNLVDARSLCITINYVIKTMAEFPYQPK